MFTRFTLTCIAVAGVLNGGTASAASTAPISAVDDGQQSKAAAPVVNQSQSNSAASASLTGAPADITGVQAERASEVIAPTQSAATKTTAAQTPVEAPDAVPEGKLADTASTPTQSAAPEKTPAQTPVEAPDALPDSTAPDTASKPTQKVASETTAAETPDETPDVVSDIVAAGTTSTPTQSAASETTGAADTPAASDAPAIQEQRAPVEISGTTIQSAPTVPPVAEPKSEPVPIQSQIMVSHSLIHSDDGSTVILTVDGKEAGVLKRGEVVAIKVSPGKHKVGGYVRTLFGMGRVTIPGVDVTTSERAVSNVAYMVTKNKPGFKVVGKKQS